MDSSCGVAGWSIVTSAAPNSGFAGTLAGFLFTGLVFLLGGRQGTEKHSPVIALFSASFLVIAFDSYLFSRVSGFDPNSGEIEVVCKSVWMAAMAASGMLVVGSASLLVGLGYLLVTHDPIGAPYLRRLAIIMGGGVLFGAPSLLLFTSFSFYQHVLRSPSWSHIYFVSGVAASLTSVFSYTLFKWTHRRGNERARKRCMEFTAYGVAGYAILCPGFAALVVRLPGEWITAPHHVLLGMTVLISLVIPALIVIGLAGAFA